MAETRSTEIRDEPLTDRQFAIARLDSLKQVRSHDALHISGHGKNILDRAIEELESWLAFDDASLKEGWKENPFEIYEEKK